MSKIVMKKNLYVKNSDENPAVVGFSSLFLTCRYNVNPKNVFLEPVHMRWDISGGGGISHLMWTGSKFFNGMNNVVLHALREQYCQQFCSAIITILFDVWSIFSSYHCSSNLLTSWDNHVNKSAGFILLF